LLSLLLVACAATPASPSVATQASSVLTIEPVAPTPTFTPTASITPSPILTKTLQPSRTPLPTLSEEEADIRVKQLRNDNGGCSLPCWWGITPGETSWDDAKAFLQTIDPSVGDSTKPSHYSFSYQFPEGPSGYGVFAEFDINDFGIVEKISLWTTATHLSLPDFLQRVGKPDQVFLQVYSFTPDGVPPFTILLVYHKSHILAEFDYRTVPKEATLLGCIDKSTPQLTLYAPSIDVQSELDQKFEWALSGGWAPYKLLEESTSIDTDSFYQTFQNSNSTNCVVTPADQWKLEP
jgi:hypothetical protein